MKLTSILINFGITLALVLGMAFFGPTNSARAAGTIYHVDVEAAGAASGLSWTDAFPTLQDAIAAAVPGDEIWVAEGHYTPDQGAGQTAGDRESSFQLPAGVAIYGGFAGNESSREDRDWETNLTVLSGDLDGNDGVDANGILTDVTRIAGDNAYSVVMSKNVTETAILDGFTITAGCTADSDPHDAGGGMRNDSSDPTLANLSFIGNSADRGGGMYNWNSSPTLTDVVFSHNHAAGGGGGMYNIELASSPVLTDVVFSHNTSDDAGGGMANARENEPTLTNVTFIENNAVVGGGMYNETKAAPILNATAFVSNTAAHGGGIYNDHAAPSLTDVSFTGNSATNGAGMLNAERSAAELVNVEFTGNVAKNDGGGINNEDSSPTLRNVTFTANSAHDGGGMCNENSSNPVLVDVIFTENTTLVYSPEDGTLVAGEGGGMDNDSSSPTLTNVTFHGNRAMAGGGMCNGRESSPTVVNAVFSGNTATFGAGMLNNWQASPRLINVTVTGNVAEQLGGGVGNNAESNPVLINTIVWGNQAPDGSEVCGNYGSQLCNTESSVPDIQNSDIQGAGGSDAWDTTYGTDLGGNIDADPQFLRAADAGDGDWGTTADNDYGSLHLGAESAAVDAGDATELPTDDDDLDGDSDTDEPLPVDLAGNSRITGTTVDMGAYESLRVYLPLVLANR